MPPKDIDCAPTLTSKETTPTKTNSMQLMETQVDSQDNIRNERNNENSQNKDVQLEGKGVLDDSDPSLEAQLEEFQRENVDLKQQLQVLMQKYQDLEARSAATQGELEASRSEVAMLQQKLTQQKPQPNDKSTADTNYSHSSDQAVTGAANSCTSMKGTDVETKDSLQSDKQHVSLELERLQSTNRDQAALLQQLNSSLRSIKASSEQEIRHLRYLLQEEQQTVQKLKQNQNGGISGSLGGFHLFGGRPSPSSKKSITPDKAKTNSTADSSVGSHEKLSPPPFIITTTNQATAVDRDHVGELFPTEDTNSNNSSSSRLDGSNQGSLSKSPSQTMNGERNGIPPQSTKSPPLANDPATGETSQASLLEEAMKKQREKHQRNKQGFWENLLSGNSNHNNHASLPAKDGTTMSNGSSSFLPNLKSQVNHQQLQQERDERLRARNEAAREKAQANIGKLKASIKWGFSMFPVNERDVGDSDDDEGDDDEFMNDDDNDDIGKKEQPTTASLVSPANFLRQLSKSSLLSPKGANNNNDNNGKKNRNDHKDLEALMKMAADRTKGLSEEELNRILETPKRPVETEPASEEMERQWSQDSEDEHEESEFDDVDYDEEEEQLDNKQ